MSKPCWRTIVVRSIFLMVLMTGGFLSPSSARASSILPKMSVVLTSGGNVYANTVFAGKPLTLVAQVKNIGNVPLQVTANAPTPANWDLEADKSSDCPDHLEVRKTCTISWVFTPQASGQVYLRVYVRGAFTNSAGLADRITQSPAFIFNVKPPKGTSGGSESGGTTSSGSVSNALPNMTVTLISGNSTYASTVFAGKPLVFRAQVKNIGGVPLAVTANLSVPTGWDLDENPDNDCPESLEARKTCTFNWEFTPQAEGQVYLRVYVRGAYTLSSGFTGRVVQSPAFIFNVKPPKATE